MNLPYKAKRPEWKVLLRMLDKTHPSYEHWAAKAAETRGVNNKI